MTRHGLTMAGQGSLNSLPPLSLYIHLPWCLKKCPYCDFNSHEIQHNSLDAALEQRYLQALIRDAEQALAQIWGRSIQSIFIGGGTPSLFQPDTIAQLLSALRARFHLVADCEITLEANPGTFERERFAAFRRAGITRLSVGVQSFQDQQLQHLGRVHSAAQAHAALAEVAQHFDSWNLDLMYALPGQDLQRFQQDLEAALSYQPPHLSIYHLSIEPNTYFAKHPPSDLPDDDVAWDMLDAIISATAANSLVRYEVSAFARGQQQRCRHNLNYWQFGDYLGLGAGAHSKISSPQHGIERQIRYSRPEHYLAQAEVGEFIAQRHRISRADLPFEYMLNALRLLEGFSPNDFAERTGLALSSIEKPLQQAETMGLISRSWQRIAPTSRGLDFLSDLQSLFLPESRPQP